MFIFIAMAVGLAVNYFTGGLSFSAILCLLAGIFLVMPGLINFDFKDFGVIRQKKSLTTLNVLRNVIVVPTLFVVSGFIFFPHNPAMRYGLAMLGILPGGGLLMSWVRQSKADTKYGFALFVLNMTVFVVLFFVLNYLIMNNFVEHLAYNTTNQTCELDQITKGAVSCADSDSNSKPFLAYFFLVILPFLLSRVVRFFDGFRQRTQKYIPIISQTATFIVIAYVFSLQSIHSIFEQDTLSFFKIFLSVLVGYVMVFVSSFVINKYSGQASDSKKSLFRNSTIRFVTLGVVFGVLYVPFLGADYVAIFASAYFIQTAFSSISLKILK